MNKNLFAMIGISIISIIICITFSGCSYLPFDSENFSMSISSNGGNSAFYESINNTENNIITLNEDDITFFENDIYINGKKVSTDEKAVIVYDNNNYISKSVLQKYVSKEFVKNEGNKWYFRKNQYGGEIVTAGDETFFPLNEIELYIRANSYYLPKVLFLITYLPSNLNFDHNGYWNSEAITAGIIKAKRTKEPSGKYVGLTEDGRDVWKDGDSLWILDDSGEYVLFVLPPYSLNGDSPQ